MILTRRRLFATLIAASAAPALSPHARAQASAARPQADGAPTVLRAGDSTHTLAAGDPPVRLWTYNDSFPGPLLRVRRGETVDVRLVNALPQPTSLHWAGARVANALDGVGGLTGEALAPGGDQRITFAAGEAGTFLYRPMVADHAAEQAERGLAGVLVVDDDTPAYADDFVLILDDILLTDAGEVRGDFGSAPDLALNGRLGNRLLINGAGEPAHLRRPPGRQLRVRIVNAANARPLTLGFDGLSVHVIAADGRPVDSPFPPAQNRLTLLPGARADVVIAAPANNATGTVNAQIGDGLPLLRLSGEGAPAGGETGDVAALAPDPLLPETIDLARARRFDIAIGGGLGPQAGGAVDGARIWRLGDTSWADAGARPLFRVPRNTPLVLALANPTPFLHALHLHGHHARQLHRLDDGWEPYWLDTVPIRPSETVRIAFLADNPGRWMLGSAVLDRLGAGLAGWFEVD